ncbi:Maf family protein [Alteromonas lipotrueiana]|uniref:Maf family protein n=1 Tax=Alteromonas lipotrueiana TaxID=2803815 RepID=UPI001C47755B|nr:Maf family protein [Alteromonas lipotrueiana]
MAPELILASASARRTALLDQMGISHRCLPVDIDESALPAEKPADMVARLACEKAAEAWQRLSTTEKTSAVVLASDTLIEFDGESLGKPVDKSDSIAILSRLSGNTHRVLTAVHARNEQTQQSLIVTTQVEFAELSLTDIEQYWQSGEPADKAGSYAIQGRGGQFVKSVTGSVSSVIGLPMYETRVLLQQFGVTV